MNRPESGSGQQKELLSSIDHLLFAAPNLQVGVDMIEELLGIRASTGGQHIGLGTRNALIALGPACYLEIIAPDPAQTEYRKPRIFGIDDLKSPKLVAWAAKGDDLDHLAAIKLKDGLRLGEVLSGSRLNPDGVELSWRFTDPFTVIAEGVIPFFIHWGQSPHPASQAAQGASLVGFRAEHPEPVLVRGILDQLSLNLPVTSGGEAALIATIVCPKGSVELH